MLNKVNTTYEKKNNQIFVIEPTYRNDDEYYCLCKYDYCFKINIMMLNIVENINVPAEYSYFVLKENIFNSLSAFTRQENRMNLHWIGIKQNSTFENKFMYKLFFEYNLKFLEVIVASDYIYECELQTRDFYFVKELDRTELEFEINTVDTLLYKYSSEVKILSDEKIVHVKDKHDTDLFKFGTFKTRLEISDFLIRCSEIPSYMVYNQIQHMYL